MTYTYTLNLAAPFLMELCSNQLSASMKSGGVDDVALQHMRKLVSHTMDSVRLKVNMMQHSLVLVWVPDPQQLRVWHPDYICMA